MHIPSGAYRSVGLNESPSEKEGKYARYGASAPSHHGLNESPSEKEGKSPAGPHLTWPGPAASMKALPKRKGNVRTELAKATGTGASMKVPPKRKGNKNLKRLG